MTVVHVITVDQSIRSLRVSGHAGQAASGSDIVCAAISSLCTTLVNALEKVVGIKPEVLCDEEAALMTITIPSGLKGARHRDAQTVAKTVLTGLQDLATEYPKHCRITIIDGRKTP